MSKIEIFEVQTSGAADGVYNCYRQKLKSTAFDPGAGDKFEDFESPPIVVQVLNLKENDPPASGYEEALALGDRIAAWFAKDDAGGGSWVGYPCTPDVRRARTTQGEPSETYITANLYANDGSTELTTGLGSDITVYGSITELEDFDGAVPRLKINQDVLVQNIQGKWWFVQVCQASEYCLCST